MAAGDKRLALRIVSGAIKFVSQGWIQGLNESYLDGHRRVCISKACGLATEAAGGGDFFSAKGRRVRDAGFRVTRTLDRLAGLRMKTKGDPSMVVYNDRSTTTKKDVLSLLRSAHRSISTGADLRARARSAAKKKR